MASTSVTQDELLEALASAQRTDPGGQSAQEMADATGVDRKKVLAALKILHRQGRLTVAQAPRMAIHGRTIPVPVYTIKKKR